MTWPGPKLGIPESVRDLDHDRVVAVLVAANVNISAAATRLRVPSSDLREAAYWALKVGRFERCPSVRPAEGLELRMGENRCSGGGMSPRRCRA